MLSARLLPVIAVSLVFSSSLLTIHERDNRATTGVGFGQKKQAQCGQAAQGERNWELIEQDYVYFDYILCPADMNPPQPLARIWITTRGNGIAVEKWAQDRDGADSVSKFYGKKKAYTLYRDLDAVPLKVFKAESRSGVPAETGHRPFMAEGSNLVPFENLTPESAERVKKVFENADIIIKKAQNKVAMIRQTPQIAVIVDSLNLPLKAQN